MSADPPRENPFRVGGPVRPAESVGRRDTLAELRHRCLTGQSSGIVGDPRIGKSTLMWSLRSDLSMHTNLVVNEILGHSFGASATAADFWCACCAGILSPQRWAEIADASRLLTWPAELSAALRDTGRSLVVLVDEFDSIARQFTLDGPIFLQQLRSVTNDHERITMVTASRQSLAEVLRHAHWSGDKSSEPFNNFDEYVLGPLTDREADTLLTRGEPELDAMARHEVRSFAGNHPFLLQTGGARAWFLSDADSDTRATQVRERVQHGADRMMREIWMAWDPPQRRTFLAVALRQADPSRHAELPRSFLSSDDLSMMQRRGLLSRDAREHIRVADGPLADWAQRKVHDWAPDDQLVADLNVIDRKRWDLWCQRDRLQPAAVTAHRSVTGHQVHIVYSRADHASCERFVDQLAPLQPAGLLAPQTVQMRACEDWDDDVLAELHRADVVVFLLSLSLINSQAMLRELPVALQLRDGGTLVVSVRICDAVANDTALADVPYYVLDDRTVSGASDPGRAWFAAVQWLWHAIQMRASEALRPAPPMHSRVHSLALVRVLFAAANPVGTPRLRLDIEHKAIDAALRASEYGRAFHLETALAVDFTSLLEAGLRHMPHILHFSGHGLDGTPYLEGNKTLNLAVLLDIVAEFRHLRCLVLNACDSADHALALTRHVPCVVSMHGAVTEGAALAFASMFYRTLGYGCPLGPAFRFACTALEEASPKERDRPRLHAAAGIDLERIRLVHRV